MQIGLKCCMGHNVWDSLSKIGIEQYQYPIPSLLYSIYIVNIFWGKTSSFQSLSNDSENLNVPITHILNKY